MHAARVKLRVRALKTTFGDDDVSPNRRLQNNIVSLNKLFYQKPKVLTGEELKNVMHGKFGPKHAMKIDTKAITITNSDLEPDHNEYNLIANLINEFTTDPEHIKSNIQKCKIIYSNGKYIIEIPLQ